MCRKLTVILLLACTTPCWAENLSGLDTPDQSFASGNDGGFVLVEHARRLPQDASPPRPPRLIGRTHAPKASIRRTPGFRRALYLHHIATAEARYALPSGLLDALVWRESRYNPFAVSKAGAAGLGQLMPGTARELGVANRFDPLANLTGSARYLSRLPGRVGPFLALTGARLDGAECFAVGLATHYLPAATLAEAKAEIAADPSRIDAILVSFADAPPPARIAANFDLIDRLFASDQFEDVLDALTADGSDWAAKELATLKTKSPQTCKVALRQLHDSLSCGDFAANMVMEYRIASRVLTRPDFAEGVRAVIVDKDNAPAWNPATPEGVTEDLIDAIFAPLPSHEEWKPL